MTSWNDAAARIFGWSAEEMIGQSITRIIPPELLPEEASILARLRRGERVEHFDTERVDQGRPAHRGVADRLADPRRAAAGWSAPRRSPATSPPASRAEATQRQLIEELNHRVKNTLATIQAIAAQSLKRSPSPEAFVRSFGGRVQALARVHDLLIAGEMAGADLGGDPRRRARARGDGRAARVAAEGPAVMLEPRLAVQMALVLHELAANARRHGALARPGGRVTVDWRIEAGPDGRRLVLDWREQGARPCPARRPAPASAWR